MGPNFHCLIDPFLLSREYHTISAIKVHFLRLVDSDDFLGRTVTDKDGKFVLKGEHVEVCSYQILASFFSEIEF